MTTTSIIRSAEATDIRHIADIEASVFSDAWSESSLSSALTDANQDILCLEHSGELAAYLIGCGVAGESEILRIAVIPSFRRHGFGRKLMEYFLNVRKAKGDLTVFLEVRASNISAIALYESCGFRSYTVRRNYYKNPTEDAVMMNLYLGN